MTTPHLHLADEVLRRLAAAIRAGQLYSKGHPIVGRSLESLSAPLQLLHGLKPSVVIGLVDQEVIVDDVPVAKAESLSGLVRRLEALSIERITIDRGVTPAEMATFLEAMTTAAPSAEGEEPALPSLPHIRVGRVSADKPKTSGDMATFQRLYREAVSLAEVLWHSAASDAQPDPTVARSLVDGLAQAVSENRTALLALTTLKNYDNYTFTHMVNVSILTMGQARALGVDGALLREFGLSALLHDIGKVRTPLEILNKPDQLTPEEFAIVRRHTIDGAGILRATPDMPTLAPVVAFEHHLRLDGSGYPDTVSRPRLNLATMLCSIADVYDAMRSQRQYQQSFPSERILAVLQRNDGRQFDQHLVRRFSQLLGIYPPGTVVRLDSGEIAVVVKAHAPDPHRPQVKIVFRNDDQPMNPPRTSNLWEHDDADDEAARMILAPLDPATLGLDPLSLL